MEEYSVKTPVAIIFFNRPDTLKKVFEAVAKAKPKQLFLIQDGARQNRKAEEKLVEECREVVKNVDWDCEVTRDYSEQNLGCGRRIFSGVSSAFEKVDRLIIIEDDIVVSGDFFKFCDELLEKYKDDQRIHRISGMCHMGEYKKSPYSYGFTNFSSCWGWATWKRSWQDMEYEMGFLDDEYIMDCFGKNYRYRDDAKSLIKTGKQRREILRNGGRLSAWTYQFSMAGRLNNRLDITPCKNLISCIGLTENSGHATNSINKIPKGMQKLFFGKLYNMEFPLKHPPYIMEDVEMAREMRIVLGWTPILRVTRRVEGIFRRIIFGGKDDLSKMFKKVFHK